MTLLDRLRRVEAKRGDVLDRADALDPLRLRARVQPDKWSILENIEHLLLAEEGRVSLTELRRRWEANHARLRRYVERLDASAPQEAVFRHPVAGPLTPAQALHMLEVHLDRHAGQIRRLERSLSRPTDPR